MKLEIGKVYKDREGDIRTIVSFVAGDSFPYKADDGMTYKEDGRFGMVPKHKLDLIAKVTDTPQHAPFEFDGVGKYRTTLGGCGVIEYYSATTGIYVGHVNGQHCDWDSNGKGRGNGINLIGTRIKQKRKLKGWYREFADGRWIVSETEPDIKSYKLPPVILKEIEFELEGK